MVEPPPADNGLRPAHRRSSMSGIFLLLTPRRKRVSQRVVGLVALPLLLVLIGSAQASDHSDKGTEADQETIKALVQRINALEARVQQLEAMQSRTSSASAVSPPSRPP